MEEAKKEEWKQLLKQTGCAACVGLAVGAVWALRYGKIQTIMVFPTKEVYGEIWDKMADHANAAIDGGGAVAVEGRKMLLNQDGVLSAK